MDNGLKKPLSLKISSPCSGLEAAGSLWAGQSSPVSLCVCVEEAQQIVWNDLHTCCAGKATSSGVDPGRKDAGLSSQTMNFLRVHHWGAQCVPIPTFPSYLLICRQDARTRGTQDELWHQSVCSWYFINWFQLMKV